MKLSNAKVNRMNTINPDVEEVEREDFNLIFDSMTSFSTDLTYWDIWDISTSLLASIISSYSGIISKRLSLITTTSSNNYF